MACVRLTLAAGCFVLGAAALLGGQEGDAGRGESAVADRWEATKLAVARESVASPPSFHRSVVWWLANVGKDAPDPDRPFAVGGDVVHVRGDLATALRVNGQSEVVIGGSILKSGRIDADDIAKIHVQGDVEGTIACYGMAEVWVGGTLSGEIATGPPVMHLHIIGDLLGTIRPAIRPASEPAGLYVQIAGNAPSTVLAAIDRHRYVQLEIAAGRSDLAPGIHPLWRGPNGFVVVAQSVAGR